MMTTETAGPVQFFPPPVGYPRPGYPVASPTGYQQSYPQSPSLAVPRMAAPPLPVSPPDMTYYQQAPPVVPPKKVQTSSRGGKNEGCLAGCLAALCCCFVLEECCCCGPTVIIES